MAQNSDKQPNAAERLSSFEEQRVALERFFSACGAERSLRLTATDPERPSNENETEIELYQPFAIVGRQRGADIVFDHWQVSKKHAYMQLIGGRLFCVDLRSRLGLRWPDGPASAGWISRQRPVQIGPIQLRAAFDGRFLRDDSYSPVCRSAATESSGPSADLEWNVSGRGVKRWRLDTELTLVGRSDACQVQLAEDTLSKFEFSLVSTAQGFWAVDLLGRGGLVINGVRVRWGWVDDGDVIQTGPVRLRLSYLDPPPLTRKDIPVHAGTSVNAPPSEPRIAHQPAMWTGANAMERGSAARSVPSAPDHLMMLQPVLERLEQMQSQMYDDFFSAMMMLSKTLVQTHRDHAYAVQTELDEIRRITAELDLLQGRLDGAASHQEARALTDPSSDVSALPDHSPIKVEAAAKPVDPEIHDRLNERIAELRCERQGRWQSLLTKLSGVA